MTVMAAIASTTATALGTMQGSCLPVTSTVSFFPVFILGTLAGDDTVFIVMGTTILPPPSAARSAIC